MQTILLMLGIYYIATGIWPILHMKSFMRITGFKKDQWLVRTVGLLILSSGIVFMMGSLKNEGFETVKILAILIPDH